MIVHRVILAVRSTVYFTYLDVEREGERERQRASGALKKSWLREREMLTGEGGLGVSTGDGWYVRKDALPKCVNTFVN